MEHTRIKNFILGEFLPDVPPEELDQDYDLLAGGVIDSLSLLKIIEWLKGDLGVDIDSVEFGPDDFRSVNAIAKLVASSSN